MHLDNQATPAAGCAAANTLLVAEPDTYDSIPSGYYDLSDGELEQVGGGRRGPHRSVSPSNTTPTRLRSRIKPSSRLLNMSDGMQDKALASVRRAMDARQAQLPAPPIDSHVSESEPDKDQSESKSLSLDEYLEENSFEPLPLPAPPPRPGHRPQVQFEQSKSKDERLCLSPFALHGFSPFLRRESPHLVLSEKGNSPAPANLPNTSSRSTSQQPDEPDNNAGQLLFRSQPSSPILMAPPSSPCSRNATSSRRELSAHPRKLAEILAANKRLAPKAPTDQLSASSTGHRTDSETSHEPERLPHPSFNVNVIPPTPATQKVVSGRPNKAILKLFEDKFEEADKLFSGLAEQCGRSVQKILQQYNRRHHSHANYTGNVWNIYQRYFTEHLEQELARLPGNSLHPLKEPCSAAFSQFQIDYKDNWHEILTTWADMVDIDTTGMTRAHRKKEFLKHTESLVHVAERGMRDGFETVILCCGNVVNDDGQLGYTYTTEGLEDFWKVRFNRDENAILGHLKAHAFNLASLSVIKSEDSYPEKDPIPASVNQESDTSNSGQADRTTPELQQRRDTADTQALQKALVARAQESGLHLTNKSRQFPWKTMLTILANDGYQLLNWPADQCPFPGAPAPSGRRGKGISGLLKEQTQALQCSLQDPYYPLTFRKYGGSNTDLVNARQPVIIGAPPKPDHNDRVKTSHALRQFVDASIDNDGPPSLKPGGGRTTIRKRKQAADTVAIHKHEIIEIRSSSSVSPVATVRQLKSLPSRNIRRKSQIVISEEESNQSEGVEEGIERVQSSKASSSHRRQQSEEINYYVNEDTEPGEFLSQKRKSATSSLTQKKARLTSAADSSNVIVGPPFTQADKGKAGKQRYISPESTAEPEDPNPASPPTRHESPPAATSGTSPDATVTILSLTSSDVEPSSKADDSAPATAGVVLSTGLPSPPSADVLPSDAVSSHGLSNTSMRSTVDGSYHTETLISTMVAPLLEAALGGTESSTEAESRSSLPGQAAVLQTAEAPAQRGAEPMPGHQIGGGTSSHSNVPSSSLSPYLQSLYAEHGIYPFGHYANAAGVYPYGMPNMMGPYGARMDYMPSMHQQGPYTSQVDPARGFPYWQAQPYVYNPQQVMQQRSTSQELTFPPVNFRSNQHRDPSQPLQCDPPHAPYPICRPQHTSHPSFGTATENGGANIPDLMFNP